MTDTQNVAPADAAYAHFATKPDQRKELPDGQGEGALPIATRPDQPTFPAPMGVPRETLEEMGVAQGYVGAGTTAAVAPEGAPADPDLAEKQGAAAEVAAGTPGGVTGTVGMAPGGMAPGGTAPGYSPST